MHCDRMCLTYIIANHVGHKMAEKFQLKGQFGNTKAFVNYQELIYCIKPAPNNLYMLNWKFIYSFHNFI